MKIIIFSIIILTNLVLAGVQLWLTSARASDGQTLTQINTQTKDLVLANWRLREQIALKSSLSYIYSQVENSKLAYTKPEFARELPVVANNPSTP